MDHAIFSAVCDNIAMHDYNFCWNLLSMISFLLS